MAALRLTWRQPVEHFDVGTSMCSCFGGETRPVAFSGVWPTTEEVRAISSEHEGVGDQNELDGDIEAPVRGSPGGISVEPDWQLTMLGTDEVVVCRERFRSGSMIFAIWSLASTFFCWDSSYGTTIRTPFQVRAAIEGEYTTFHSAKLDSNFAC